MKRIDLLGRRSKRRADAYEQGLSLIAEAVAGGSSPSSKRSGKAHLTVVPPLEPGAQRIAHRKLALRPRAEFCGWFLSGLTAAVMLVTLVALRAPASPTDEAVPDRAPELSVAPTTGAPDENDVRIQVERLRANGTVSSTTPTTTVTVTAPAAWNGSPSTRVATPPSSSTARSSTPRTPPPSTSATEPAPPAASDRPAPGNNDDTDQDGDTAPSDGQPADQKRAQGTPHGVALNLGALLAAVLA